MKQQTLDKMDIDITVKEARESKIEDDGELGDIKKE